MVGFTVLSNSSVNYKGRIMTQTVFEGIGWRMRLQHHRGNYFLTLVKEIVIGNALKGGDIINYYLVDYSGRKALLVFLDGQERPNPNVVQLKNSTFFITTKQTSPSCPE